MDKCSKRIASSKVFDELVKLIGHDDVLQTSVFLEVFGTDDFSQSFLDQYAENNKNAELPSIETKNVSQAKKIAKERAEELCKDIVDKLEKQGKTNFSEFSDPDIQYILNKYHHHK